MASPAGVKVTVSQLTDPPCSQVTANARGGSHRVIVPPALPCELVAPAEAQLAGDRQEPSRDALGIGEGVPHLFGGAGIPASRHHDPGGPSVLLPRPDDTRDRADHLRHVHVRVPFRRPGVGRGDHDSIHLYKSTLIFGAGGMDGDPKRDGAGDMGTTRNTYWT